MYDSGCDCIMAGSRSRPMSCGVEPCLASDRIVTYSKTPAFVLLVASSLQADCKEGVAQALVKENCLVRSSSHFEHEIQERERERETFNGS
jgi:hypothetical protein